VILIDFFCFLLFGFGKEKHTHRMKFFVAVVLLAALFAACSAVHSYIYPNAPCKWGMKMDIYERDKHYSIRTYVFGALIKTETYNHNGDLVYATLYRPDLLNGGSYIYNGATCDVGTSSKYSQTIYGMIGSKYNSLGSNRLNFNHIDDAKRNGRQCMVYFNKKKSTEALYVDMTGYPVAYVVDEDHPGEVGAVGVNFTFYDSISIHNSDFTFSKSYAHRCADERVYHLPDTYFSQCTASTSKAVVGFVVATILAALVIVF